MIGFRNILVDGYAQVDDTRVWRTVHESLPALLETVRRLMDELDS